jgi:hypothetical protein
MMDPPDALRMYCITRCNCPVTPDPEVFVQETRMVAHSGIKGARACNPVRTGTMDVFNLYQINQTYTCYVYPPKDNVFLDDPRSDIYATYVAGLVFGVAAASIVSRFLTYRCFDAIKCRKTNLDVQPLISRPPATAPVPGFTPGSGKGV